MTIKKVETIEEFVSAFYCPGGMEQIMKVDAPILGSTTGFYVPTYGAKVWAQLNTDANTFGMIPKWPWDRSGWRVETTKPATSSHGVDSDSAALPETTKPTVVEVVAEPKVIPTNFDETWMAQFKASLSDGLGDLMAWMRQRMADHHREMINVQLFADGGVVTNQSTDIESLDRICGSYGELSAYQADQTTSYSTSDLDPYSTSLFNRDAGAGWLDAQVLHATKGGLRNLSITLIDQLFELVQKAGGRPKVMITGFDTARKIAGLWQAHYGIPMASARVTPSMNGVQGIPGVEVGTAVATYNNVPIIPDKDCLVDTGGISRIYLLDTDYLGFKTALPTAYFEGGMSKGDPFALNAFKSEGMYLTAGELICTKFSVQGKLRDLK